MCFGKGNTPYLGNILQMLKKRAYLWAALMRLKVTWVTPR